MQLRSRVVLRDLPTNFTIDTLLALHDELRPLHAYVSRPDFVGVANCCLRLGRPPFGNDPDLLFFDNIRYRYVNFWPVGTIGYVCAPEEASDATS